MWYIKLVETDNKAEFNFVASLYEALLEIQFYLQPASHLCLSHCVCVRSFATCQSAWKQLESVNVRHCHTCIGWL